MNELKFTLTIQSTDYLLDTSPDGWNESLITWERSEKYFGIFRTWTIPLKFVKTGATLLRTEFYNYGMKADVSMKIEKLDKITLTYAIAYAGKLDFATYKDKNYYVECSFVDSGLAKILKDNSGTEYETYCGLLTAMTPNVLYSDDRKFNWYGPSGDHEYYGMEFQTLGKNLLNYMSNEGLINGDFLFKSDYLTALEAVYTHPIITVGKTFRYADGFIMPPVKTTFDDWFKSINAIYCLGMGIEVDPTTGLNQIRIEPKSYFFSSLTTADLGEVASLQTSINTKLAFGRIKVGYEPKTYSDDTTPILIEEEINATSNWSIMNDVSSQELDLVSKFRGDGSGIRDIVNLENDSNDDDIFFLEIYPTDYPPTTYSAYYDGANRHFNLTDEAIAYNVHISPRRMLLNWYNYICSCFFGMEGETIKFTSADNDIAFRESITQHPGTWMMERVESVLNAPVYFTPIVFEIETAYPYNVIALIAANPQGLFLFTYEGKEYKGYITKVDAKLAGRGTQKITLMAHPDNDFTKLIR